jgi:hypothetical protein
LPHPYTRASAASPDATQRGGHASVTTVPVGAVTIDASSELSDAAIESVHEMAGIAAQTEAETGKKIERMIIKIVHKPM